MNVAFQALTANAANKLAGAELALFKAGQILQALVVGQVGAGLTQLRIGDVLIEAQLPQPAQPGTTLQLQVKIGGQAPQLALLNQQAPAAMVDVARVPLPVPVVNVVLPEVETPVVAAQPRQVPAPPVPAQQSVTSQATAVQPVINTPQVPQSPVPQSPSLPQQAVPLPATQQTQVVNQQEPIAPQAQVVSAPGSHVESNVQAPAPAAAPTGGPPAQAPQGVLTPTPLPSAPTPVLEQSASVSQPAPPVSQQSPPSQLQAPAQPPVTATAAAVVAAEQRSAAPVISQPPIVQPIVAAHAPEPVEANPLLLAQAAPKVLQTAAELPHVVTVQSGAPVAPQPLPATPEQALAQMAPAAMAKQNSVAPLLQSLAALVAKPASLPEPIVRAALQVLAQRVAVPDGKVAAADVEKAVARSGLFLEAGLATATPVRGDAKAALLNLKVILEKFLGGAPPANPPADREAPPLKGVPPRAMAMDLPPLPADPRDAARVLHNQTDAAVSRVKLGQLAGLPDAPTAPRPGQPELRMELPLLVGHELVMAQLQIMQDGRREPTTRKRGWTMRFAMNFSQTGEVGAEVGLLGKAVNVSLWAVEPETAEALHAGLPDLAQALEALGLDPGAVRIRSSVPEAPKIASGHFVDATT